MISFVCRHLYQQRCVATMLLCLGLAGCSERTADPLKYIDADNKVERAEFEDRFWPERSKRDAAKESKQVDEFLDEIQQEAGSEAPDLTSILASPQEPPIHNDRLISIAVTEDVPLKDVFMEIGRLADISIEVDPKIEGGILLRAKEQPLMDIIERIAEMSSLRYSNHNGVLRIERDTPYLVNYTVDYLNMIRANTNSIQTSMQLGGNGGNSNNGSGSTNNNSNSSSSNNNSSSSSVTTGSSSSVTSSSSVDLWQEVQTNINSILNQSGKSGDKTTSGKAADSDNKAGVGGTQQPYMSINKVAGIISVFANAKQQKSVGKYLAYVKATSSAQVLIEAKIVEVSLAKEYHSGVSWTQFFKRANELGAALSYTQANTAATKGITIGVLGKSSERTTDTTNMKEFIQALETFGTVTTLSSPRLHAMNNQQSLLSFVQNYVYFTLNMSTTPATTSTAGITAPTQQVTSTINTVPLGVVLNIQPSINIETQEITMNVRPTLTRQTDTVQDPATLYLLSLSTDAVKKLIDTNKIGIPVVQVRELDSVVRIKNGDTMVIGGMIEQRSENTDQGVPFLGKLPFAGNLFKVVDKVSKVVETVVFLKATIIEGTPFDQNDKELYEKFISDPHPIEL